MSQSRPSEPSRPGSEQPAAQHPGAQQPRGAWPGGAYPPQASYPPTAGQGHQGGQPGTSQRPVGAPPGPGGRVDPWWVAGIVIVILCDLLMLSLILGSEVSHLITR